jgi:hypothetical protein
VTLLLAQEIQVSSHVSLFVPSVVLVEEPLDSLVQQERVAMVLMAAVVVEVEVVLQVEPEVGGETV